MGCTHPFGIERITDDDGNLYAVRCPACKMISFASDTKGDTVRRGFLHWLRSLL